MSKETLPSLSNRLAIYLAGSIKKAHEPSNELFWTDLEMDALKDALRDYELAFLNPALRTDDLSLQTSVFGRDMLMVYSSDFVLVDARQRRGLGVGAEMMWAKTNKIPVIAYAPKDSHYRWSKTSLLGVEVKDWIHPFIESLSDYLADNLTDAAAWIQKYVQGDSIAIKGPEFMHQAMRLYHLTQYSCDLPMQELVENSEALKQRILRATGPK